jgi:hypothetical protein
MDIINEFLKRTREVYRYSSEYARPDEPEENKWIQVTRPRINCVDGFSISVQAGREWYSLPPTFDEREEQFYTHVELGFPSDIEPLIMEYKEGYFDEEDYPNHPTKSVYFCVPVELVCEMIDKHGGMVN